MALLQAEQERFCLLFYKSDFAGACFYPLDSGNIIQYAQ
jgi:hypothetical protein